jgi:hypothetical protein
VTLAKPYADNSNGARIASVGVVIDRDHREPGRRRADDTPLGAPTIDRSFVMVLLNQSLDLLTIQTPLVCP